ncbi:MAG: DUF58 domain-containing protein [Oscillospiraceae bacterium]
MKFLYPVILIVLVFFFILYNDDLSLIILIAAAVFPLVLLIALLYEKRKIKIEMVPLNPQTAKGENAEAAFILKNTSVFPVSAAKMTIVCRYVPFGDEQRQQITVPVPAMGKQTLTIKLRSDHCCRVECSAEQIRIYDFLHLFSVKIKSADLSFVYTDFVPNGDASLEPSVLAQLSVKENVSGEANLGAVSFNRQEYDELREYRDGDKLNRIAWKLSGKTGDELIVRDSSSKSEPVYLLLLDIYSAEGSPVTADKLYELFYTAAETMCSHEIMFDSFRADGTLLENISVTDGFSECISGIYGNFRSMDSIIENSKNKRYDKIVYVTASDDKAQLNEAIKKFGAREAVVIYSPHE